MQAGVLLQNADGIYKTIKIAEFEKPWQILSSAVGRTQTMIFTIDRIPARRIDERVGRGSEHDSYGITNNEIASPAKKPSSQHDPTFQTLTQ